MRYQRESNIELLRLVAIFMMLVIHANYNAIGAPTWAEWKTDTITSFFRVFSEQACCICVNLFVFISGWYGIRPTAKKTISLLFTVLFCTIVVLILAKYVFGVAVGPKEVMKGAYLGFDYWFVVAYFILSAFAPVLNTFVEHAKQKQILSFLIVFYLLSTLYGIHPLDVGRFTSGLSGLSFLGLYVLARYVRLFPGKFFSLKPSADILIYLGCTLVATLLMAVQTWKGVSHILLPVSYNHPLVIVGTVFFFLAFSKIHLRSSLVNYLAPSVFSVYLIHSHPILLKVYTEKAGIIYQSYSGLLCIMVYSLFILAVAFCCMAIDQIRRSLWYELSAKLS